MKRRINLILSYCQIPLLWISYYFYKAIQLNSKNQKEINWIIGVDEIAGCIHLLKNTFSSSENVCLGINRSYKYTYNYSINIDNKYISFLWRFIYGPLLLGYLINRNSHFLYIWNTGFLLNRDFEFKFLKSKNKKIVCMFVGDDIRSLKLTSEYTKRRNIDYHISYTQNEYSENFILNDLIVKKTAISADKYADLIFSFKLDQISYIKNKQFPWAYMYPKEKFFKDNNKFNSNNIIKIVHAPSNPLVKGTPLVRAAIKKLELEGYIFEYVELKNMSNEIVLNHLRTSHIVLNQFYGYDISLGLLAIEGMANHNALLMSYDPDAIKYYNLNLEGFDSCLLNTKYWEVYDNLKYLLNNHDKIKYYADKGYAFTYKHYTYESASEYMNNILKENGVID